MQAVLNAMEYFEQMRQEQYAVLREGGRADWLAWHEKRGRAFEGLRQSLSALAEAGNSVAPEDVAAVREQLAALLAGEQELAEAVRERRATMEKEQAAVRRGRSALTKMSVYRGGAPPRFLSNRA